MIGRVILCAALLVIAAPGAAQTPQVDAARDIVKLKLASGAVWNFLWEGADMRIEDSVRQSAYFGFHRTKQIVLEVLVGDVSEVSWIFTLDEG